eukprot:1414627-Pleurochrysis_carterae.AAC.1
MLPLSTAKPPGCSCSDGVGDDCRKLGQCIDPILGRSLELARIARGAPLPRGERGRRRARGVPCRRCSI